MEANRPKADFYIYALVSTSEKAKGENSLRVDVGTFDGLGQDIEYIGISRNMPQKRLSQHQSKKLFENVIGDKVKNLGMFVIDSGIKSEWHALRDEAKLVSDYFDQFGEAPKLQGAANSGKYGGD
jgi:hypothetical protein